MATVNIQPGTVKLTNAINILTQEIKEDKSFTYINEILLNKIIVTESSKGIHTKNVDKENKKGCFEAYKKVINKVADLILEVNAEFKYAHMLVTTVIEGAQQQQFYREHLPSLIDDINTTDTITSFYNEMVFKMIKK